MRLGGRRYDAEVPATLDLAERSRFAINALTRAIVAKRWYSVWQSAVLDSNPPQFAWPNSMSYKYLEAPPRLCMMCGGERTLDVEQAMMQACVGRIGPHGPLCYPPISPCNPPNMALPLGRGLDRAA